eukprot:4576537-Ditylum_brightwellii.AAC.1
MENGKRTTHNNNNNNNNGDISEKNNVDGDDATEKSTNMIPREEDITYDMVMFNHPHLGTAHLASEAFHASRHHALLSHYIHSASSCLSTNGIIHICLCGSQPTTWDVMGAAKRLGADLFYQVDTMQPMHNWLLMGDNTTPNSTTLVPNDILKHYPSPRRYRNGRLGSKHFLGKYGYRHRRTHGDLYVGGDDTNGDMKVFSSVNILFQPSIRHITPSTKRQQQLKQDDKDNAAYQCFICHLKFQSKQELDLHYDSPLSSNVLQPDILSLIPKEEEKQENTTQALYKDEETGRTFGTLYGLVTFQNQQK